MLAQRVVAEQRTHGKTITHPVLARVAVNAENLLHDLLLLNVAEEKAAMDKRYAWDDELGSRQYLPSSFYA
ncbi:hypothetical protein D3C80_1967310 [compost metagenome]